MTNEYEKKHCFQFMVGRMEEEPTDGGGAYRWRRSLQVGEEPTYGGGAYRWGRSLQMEEEPTGGGGAYRWGRSLQMGEIPTDIYIQAKCVPTLKRVVPGYHANPKGCGSRFTMFLK